MNISERLAKPKWQRAKILECPNAPQIIGREIFCKITEPLNEEADSYPGYGVVEATPSYIVALRPSSSRYSYVLLPTKYAELLARSSEDFLFEDPPFLTWEEFLAQGATDDPAR
jgi:hypothetical protein